VSSTGTLTQANVLDDYTKTVMGFIILAVAIKYLSNIDQVLQWGLVTRERFLAAWIGKWSKLSTAPTSVTIKTRCIS